jgi:hypothetical protein
MLIFFSIKSSVFFFLIFFLMSIIFQSISIFFSFAIFFSIIVYYSFSIFQTFHMFKISNTPTIAFFNCHITFFAKFLKFSIIIKFFKNSFLLIFVRYMSIEISWIIHHSTRLKIFRKTSGMTSLLKKLICI